MRGSKCHVPFSYLGKLQCLWQLVSQKSRATEVSINPEESYINLFSLLSAMQSLTSCVLGGYSWATVLVIIPFVARHVNQP